MADSVVKSIPNIFTDSIQYASGDKESVAGGVSQSITVLDHTFSLANDGVLVVFIDGELKLDKYTCEIRLYVDDNWAEITGTAQAWTTVIPVSGMRIRSISAGTRRVRVVIVPQTGATVSIPTYSHYKACAVILGAPPAQT